jgi:hypothetical protein
MNSPDPQLMKRFHTEDVYKQKLAGGLPFGLAPLMGAMNVARNQSDDDEESELQAQAYEMSERMRAARALMMQPINEKLQHTHAPLILAARRTHGMVSGEDVPVGMDEGMIRMASVAGRVFAHVDLNAVDFDKEAGIGGLVGGVAKGIGGVAKGAVGGLYRGGAAIGRGVGSLGTGIANRAKGLVGGIKSAPGSIGQKMTNLGSRVENWGKSLGNRLETGVKSLPPPSATAKLPTAPIQAANGQMLPAPTKLPPMKGSVQAPPAAPAGAPGPHAYRSPPAPAATGTVGKAPPKPDVSTEPTGGQTQAPQPPPAAQSAGALQGPPPRANPPIPGATLPPPPPRGQAVPPAQPVVQPAPATAQSPTASTGTQTPAGTVEGPQKPGWLEKNWQQSGLADGGWKTKLPMLAAGGLGLYGMYQGAKALKNYADKEPEPYAYGAGAPQPASGVNQYGYADRTM